MDTIKTWISTAQAALLAGKNVSIVFATSGTNYCISQVDLLQ